MQYFYILMLSIGYSFFFVVSFRAYNCKCRVCVCFAKHVSKFRIIFEYSSDVG